MIILMDIVVMVGMSLLGAALGSFAGAQVWRLRAAQLEYDKREGEDYDKHEYARLKPLLNKSFRKDRSQCLSCHHELRWYDLVPIISWLALLGKCRYCRKPIGVADFLLELAMGALFLCVITYWPGSLSDPLGWVKLGVLLVAMVALAINFMYDYRWYLLVSGLNWLVIGCGVVFAGAVVLQSSSVIDALWTILGSVMVLGGLYGVLSAVSKGRLVGEGDIYLGAGLGLLLADWRLSFIALFAANLIGTVLILPQLLSRKLERGSHVPLGPLLILGFLVAWFFGENIITWYQQLIFF